VQIYSLKKGTRPSQQPLWPRPSLDESFMATAETRLTRCCLKTLRDGLLLLLVTQLPTPLPLRAVSIMDLLSRQMTGSTGLEGRSSVF